jgi:hypothetical protein
MKDSSAEIHVRTTQTFLALDLLVVGYKTVKEREFDSLATEESKELARKSPIANTCGCLRSDC